MQAGEMHQSENKNSGFLLCSFVVFVDLEITMKCALALIL